MAAMMTSARPKSLRGVLQLEGQHECGELLDETDGHPAPERALDATHPAEHDAGVHDDDEVDPDEGLDRVVENDESSRYSGNCRAEPERNAMCTIDVDSIVERGLGVVGRGTQRLSHLRMAHHPEEDEGNNDGDPGIDGARLVEENGSKLVVEQRDLPGC
jgi:hypothetical protein